MRFTHQMDAEKKIQSKNNVNETDVIEIHELEKSFNSNHVLRKFSLNLSKGESVAVLGKSGSGKSVLIKCIIGLLKPDAGTIKIFGREIGGFNQNEMDNMRRRVGFLFQSNALYDSMSVKENLAFPLRRHRVHLSEKEQVSLIQQTLSDVGLEQTMNMMPAELSGGMKKRIALARTLILKPEIILYDEPTTGLDPVTSREISKLINQVQKKYNTTAMVISHDMSCVHLTSSRVVILLNGQCHASNTYNQLAKSEDAAVKQFFE
jgi:phospholipid/cholesterol/gamma-HCH transport system ATP-binding protein